MKALNKLDLTRYYSGALSGFVFQKNGRIRISSSRKKKAKDKVVKK